MVYNKSPLPQINVYKFVIIFILYKLRNHVNYLSHKPNLKKYICCYQKKKNEMRIDVDLFSGLVCEGLEID